MMSPSEFAGVSGVSSPFICLGRDIFERILIFVAGVPPASPTFTTDAIRFILPFALVNNAHYCWANNAVRSLSMLPLNYASNTGRSLHAPTRPLPFSALFSSSSTVRPLRRAATRQPSRRVPPVDVINAISIYPNIQTLNLSPAVDVADLVLAMIAVRLPNIRELRISRSHDISVLGIEALAHSRFLERLDLSYCAKLGDSSAAAIRAITSLRALNIARWKVCDASVGIIAELPKLESLNLFACIGLKQKTFCLLGEKAKELSSLKICVPNAPDLTESIRALSGCRKLRAVDFRLSQSLSDDNLSSLGDPILFPKLESVSVSQCSMLSDNLLRSLSGNMNIRRLDLSCCELLTDAATESITVLRHLEDINLEGCKNISDEGVKRIAELPYLRVLSVARCSRLTDKSAVALAETQSKPLESLDVRNCPQITAVGLGRLKASCAKLRH